MSTSPTTSAPAAPSKALRHIPMSDETLHAGHLKLLDRLAKMRGLQFKLATYFAGMSVACLADIHGVSQGKGGKQGEESWADFLKRVTGIPYRSAHRYRTSYQQIITAHPESAKRLNAQWAKLTDAKALTNGEAAEATMAAIDLPAKALQAIAEEPDQWDLHELFAPEEEEEPASDDEDDDSEQNKLKRAAIISFWNLKVTRRLKAGELLRLPKKQREAIITNIEEALREVKQAQAAKGAPKKKGAAKP